MAQFGRALDLQKNHKRRDIIDKTLIKGITTELQCMCAFIERGYQIGIPYGNCNAYDFIVDTGSKLIRMQCKSSSWYKGKHDCFYFSCRRIHQNTKEVLHRTYAKADIDYFVTYFQGKCYIVPVEECGSAKILRCSPTQNGNKKNINWAKNYEIDNIVL